MDIVSLIRAFDYLPIVSETLARIRRSTTQVHVMPYPQDLLNRLVEAQCTTIDRYVGAVTIHEVEKCTILINIRLPLVIQMTLLVHEWMHVIDHEMIFKDRMLIAAEERAYAHQARFVSELRNIALDNVVKRNRHAEFEHWAKLHPVLTLESGTEEMHSQLSYLKTDFSESRKSKSLDRSA